MSDNIDKFGFLEDKGNHVLLKIWVQPGARKSQIIGLHNGLLKVQIKSPPVEGKANKEVINFFSKILNFKKNKLEIIVGEKTRSKILKIECRYSDLESKINSLL